MCAAAGLWDVLEMVQVNLASLLSAIAAPLFGSA